MDELFGAPMENIAAVLAVAFGLALAFLLYIRVRNPILVRMAFRNVLRRPGQSLLILAGLMLATAIISSAFTVGDSVTYSIKNTAAASLRRRASRGGRGLERLGGAVPCPTAFRRVSSRSLAPHLTPIRTWTARCPP